MKKLGLILVILLTMSFVFVGCTNQEPVNSNTTENDNTEQTVADTNDSADNEEQQPVNDPNADEKALSVVKKLEIFDHSFSNYGILYNNYIDKVNSLFFEGEVPTFNADKHFKLSYVAAGEEAKAYTDEQRKAAKEENKNQVTIEVSKVFTEEGRNWKYVYTKATVVDPTKEEGKQTSYIYRRYVLIAQEGDWKILSLDQFNCEEGTEEQDIMFNKYNNEVVQYSDSIPFVQ